MTVVDTDDTVTTESGDPTKGTGEEVPKVQEVPSLWLRPAAVFVWTSVGLFGVVVGLHDAIEASFVFRLFGIGLALAGLLSIAGILHDPTSHRNWRTALGLIASLAATLAAGMMFVTSVTGIDIDQWRDNLNRILPWLGVTILTLGVTIVALQQLLGGWPRERGSSSARSFDLKTIGKSAPAGILSVVVSGVTWIYATQLAPLDVTPNLSVQAQLQQAGKLQNMTVVAGSINIRNLSETRVSVVGSMYRVYAANMSPQPPGLQPPNWALVYQGPAQAELADQSAKVGVLRQPPQLEEVGRIVPVGWILDKNAEYHMSFVSYVPPDYNYVRLIIEVGGAKNEVLRLDATNSTPEDAAPDYNLVGRYVSVVEPSWVQLLTRPARNVEDRWLIGSPITANDYAVPRLNPCIYYYTGPTGHAKCTTSNNRFYGLVVSRSQYELFVRKE